MLVNLVYIIVVHVVFIFVHVALSVSLDGISYKDIGGQVAARPVSHASVRVLLPLSS